MKTVQKAKCILLVPLIIILTCVCSSIAGCIASHLGLLKIIDLKILDWMMVLKGGIEADENIILVIINEKSIKDIGQAYGPEWREFHPKIIEQLKKAKIIAIDLYFDGKTIHDFELSKKLAETKNSVIATHEHAEIPDLILSNSKPGFIEVYPDIDGQIRRLQPVKLKTEPASIEKDTVIRRYYYQPSFLFRIIQLYFDEPYSESDYGKKIYGVEQEPKVLKIGVARQIPTDNDGMMYIRDTGKSQAFTEIAYHEIYNGKFDTKVINEKKIIIIGKKTAYEDIHNTQYGPKYGVTIQALALNTVLKEAYIRHVNGYAYLAILFASSFILTLTFVRKTKTHYCFLTLTLTVLSVIITYLCYWIQTMPLLVVSLITFGILTVFRRFIPNLREPKRTEISWGVFVAIIILASLFGIGILKGEKELLTGFYASIAATAAWYLIDKLIKRKKEKTTIKEGE
jgi:CHASE2 domain-containing sensor protein